MGNKYQYIDPAERYIQKNGVLVNKANIEDEKILIAFESFKVSRRIEELYKNPIEINDSNALLKIHHFLFQDVYAWAGEVRTVNISKDGRPFFDGERFQMGFKFIDDLLIKYRAIQQDNRSEIAKKLAEILDAVNYLHPFREGNGRTQREFIRLLALEKNLLLNLNPPNNKSVYERYMKGTINGDSTLLTELILERMSEVR